MRCENCKSENLGSMDGKIICLDCFETVETGLASHLHGGVPSQETGGLAKTAMGVQNSPMKTGESSVIVPSRARTGNKSRRSALVDWRVRNVTIEHDQAVRVKARKEGFTTVAALVKTLVHRWLYPDKEVK